MMLSSELSQIGTAVHTIPQDSAAPF
jgi:hypothetical protein